MTEISVSRLAKVNKADKKVVIIGATSGIGRRLAYIYMSQGCTVGITGRRGAELEAIRNSHKEKIFIRQMDVRDSASIGVLEELIGEMGGMDLIIYCAGVGTQNTELEPEIEIDTVRTNADGFCHMTIYSYNYFKARGEGHIAVISSLAGIKSLRQSPAYSATKRFQMHYMSCLAQKANKEKLQIAFTTIIAGFIVTDMLKFKYPFAASLEKGGKLIFNAIEKKYRYATIPGRWRWVEAVWRLIPNPIWEKVW